MADLQPDVPAKLEVAPGDYLVSAATPDGQKWSKAIQVKAPKTVVKIDFWGTAATAPAAPRASTSSTGTLLVFADSRIDLDIDGNPSGSLSGTPESPGQRVFTLTPGKHFLKAVSLDFPEVNAAADVQIREGAQELIRAMVADQVAEKQAALRAAEAARVEIEMANTRVKELDLRRVNIPAGKFRMGCSSGDKDCFDNENLLTLCEFACDRSCLT